MLSTSEGINDKFDVLDDIVDDMCHRKARRRPSCDDIIKDQDKWTIKLSSLDITQEFIDNINQIESTAKSKYHLAIFIKHCLHINQ